jgi:predicted Zn-dependent peptidase
MVLVWWLIAMPAASQDLASFEKRVTVRTLANGLTVIVCERREAPVVSFYTHVDVGSAQEVPGITGLAHMFEHMAFKGTPRIGTSDWPAEKAALDKVEEAYRAYDLARRGGAEGARVAALERAWRDAIRAADRYVVRNGFGEIIEREGGKGLNAFTSSDETAYYFAFPSNRVELWALLESERFLYPVMREFYKERSVVMEERRMRIDSNPTGRLIEQFLAAAFSAHPYGQAGIGWPSDLQSFSATDAMRFYERYYVPSNLTIGIVGDVQTAEVLRIVEKYFGRWEKKPAPGPLRTVEPPQRGERMVRLQDRAQPLYMEGYHRPAKTHADDPVFAVLGDLLSNGRTSRMFRALVRDKKIAADSAGFNGYPGEKYPHLFIVYGVPLPGRTNEDIRDALRAELERLKTEAVSETELRMVRTRAKASLLRRLDNNTGLAGALATAHRRYGDWREMFRRVERIERVTAADVMRVAKATFVRENRTVGILESTRPAKEVAP